MIQRILSISLIQSLDSVPATCILGPRQVGKTTLALETGKNRAALYLDLESETDRAKLAEAEYYLDQHRDELVILDEVHRAPGLFPTLRGLIDHARRRGSANGRYLLLGSASPELLRQSGETLAGRIRYLELAPFSVLEPVSISTDIHWLRGGFPDSLLAADETLSLRWRQDFIRTYLERDFSQFAPRIAAENLRRFWTMLAHRQGAPLNTAELARNIGIDTATVTRYLGFLVDLFLLRRLQPWHANVGKRLVKAPKIYVRDSGILHALLNLPNLDALLVHPVLGASWEGFVIENLLSHLPAEATPYFYRSSGGAEIDLVIDFPDTELWAVEIKRSFRPRIDRGFHEACSDLAPRKKFVVYPGLERYPLGADIEAISLRELTEVLRKR
ncbi:MAG: ATP-binding protein [Ignavibacteria bacterium]|nr:ATP-binding protein [Ignavibacteria bacterium]